MNGLSVLVLLFSVGSLTEDAPKKVSLADAIQLAEKNSPVLRAARADVDAAKAGAQIARAGTLPQISANGFATTGNNAGIMTSAPMAMPPVSMVFPTGNFLDGNLALMVPIIAPRLQAMLGAASWQARAAAGDLAEARADVSLQVTESYDRVLLARQMILAEQAKVSAGQELVRTTQAQFDAGKGIEASVQRSLAELSRAQRALITARNDESKSLLDLEAAMNVDLSSELDPTGILVTSTPTANLEDYLRRAYASRGVIVAARARQRAAASEIGASEGQRRPQLYGALMSDVTNRSEMGGLSAGLTLSIPIFDAGRIRAEVDQSKAMKRKADAMLKQAELTVEREVRQAWLDVQSAMANANSAEAAVKSAQSAYDVTALRVSVGKGIVVEQLDALEALVRAKSDLAQSTFDQTFAVAKLSRAAGVPQ